MTVLDVAVGVEQLLFAREMAVRIPRSGRRIAGRHRSDVLPLQPVADVHHGAVVIAQRIQHVGPAPAEIRLPPGHGAMHHALAIHVPDGVCGNAKCRADSVHVVVRRVQGQRPRSGFNLRAAGGEYFGGIVRQTGAGVTLSIGGNGDVKRLVRKIR